MRLVIFGVSADEDISGVGVTVYEIRDEYLFSKCRGFFHFTMHSVLNFFQSDLKISTRIFNKNKVVCFSYKFLNNLINFLIKQIFIQQYQNKYKFESQGGFKL